MIRTLAFVGIAALAVVLAACEHEYVYEPTVSTTSAVAGRPASYVAIPPEAPRGDVRVATLGFVDIHPQGAPDDVSTRAIHVRMIVANNSHAPWTLDTREQLLALPGRGDSRPAYATADAGTPPIVPIGAGEKRTVDLFYPLPPDLQRASALPSFDTIWKVDTDARAVVERTPFERLEIVPAAYDGYGYDYGWGSPYWYDPYYAGGAFVGVRLGPAYVERPVLIRPYVGHAPSAHRR